MAVPTAPRVRKRRVVTLGRVAAVVSRNVRAIERTIDPFADAWDAHNDEALAATGPLWVVFGDSTGQGIGASHPHNGFVGVVLERLRTSTGEPWRLLNLSITGAKMGDVLDMAIPAWEQLNLTADLSTCAIGANDMIGPKKPELLADRARELVEQLPPGTLLGRAGIGFGAAKSRAINEVFDDAEIDGQVHLWSPWDWPERFGTLARDRFHPNDKGYGFLADQLWSAVRPHVGVTQAED